MTERELTTHNHLEVRRPATLNQHGSNGVQIAHADTVHAPTILIGTVQPTSAPGLTAQQHSLSADAYHLFVTNDDPFEDNRFLVDRCRALNENEYTDEDFVDDFASLSPEAIETLKTYPAIVTTENHDYGETDEDHLAFWGFLNKIRVRSNGIRITFTPVHPFPLQRLNENAGLFGIEARSRFSELNRNHWALKRVNLLRAFTEAEIPYTPYMFPQGGD